MWPGDAQNHCILLIGHFLRRKVIHETNLCFVTV